MNDYCGLEARFHDQFWKEEEVDELPLLLEFLKGVSGPVLYPGSGSGRLLSPLRERGFEVLGIEPSEDMRRLSAKASERVFEGSWEDYSGDPGEAEAVILPTFTLQLMDRPIGALEKAYQLTGRTGRAYLSLFFPWAELSGELRAKRWNPDREMELEGGGKVVLHTYHELDERRGVLKRRHRYRILDEHGKVIEEQESRQRIQWFTDLALGKMLKRAGWEVEREVNNFDVNDGGEDGVSVISLFLRKLSN